MDTLKEHWTKDKELIEKRAAELGAEVMVRVAESFDETADAAHFTGQRRS